MVKSLNISEVPIGLLIMVFFFTSTVVDPPVTLFMGLDKHENEELIKWGWPEDVWFHVDKVLLKSHDNLLVKHLDYYLKLDPFLAETFMKGQLCSRIFEAGTWTNIG